MTLPRPIGLDETVMAQKRCYRGEFRLRPEAQVNQAIAYCLAYCAHKFEIDLHEFQVLSNHPHVLETDPFGRRPRFFQLFHSLVARSLNRLFKEGDAVFSSQRYSAPVLQEGEDVFEHCCYVLCNAVDAEIVRYPWEWEGVNSWSMEYDRPVVIKRPDFFFSTDMPEQVELVIRRPPHVRPELSDRQLRAEIREAARKESGNIAARVRASGRAFRGMKRALKIPRHHTPRDRMSRGGHQDEIRPHVAAKNSAVRIAALRKLKEFWRDYARALEDYEDGKTDVVFPAGTYEMKRRYCVRCRDP